ncbi:MAG: OB-fold domain-containing protein [Alphaproteobacteria bacterium]|nr:OB-fold domain-containing protein [Alphaproteobacteria bacterium]
MNGHLPPGLPQPRETPTNAPMLHAWRTDGGLALQRCAACAKVIFYPRPVCPHCWDDRLVWFRAAGTGTVLSFTQVHRGLPAAFQADAPVIVAEIALAEGAAMIARIVAPDPAAVRSGMAVRLVPPAEAVRFPLPTFMPA